MIDTRLKIEAWQKWRHYRFGGFGKSLFARLLDGLPTTKCPACRGHARRLGGPCPTCQGEGKIKLEGSQEGYRVVRCTQEMCLTTDPVTGEERHSESCFYCRGTGVKIIPTAVVNPAFIRSTYQDSGNPECERIDRMVCEIAQRAQLECYFRIVFVEYIEKGAGLTRARRAQRLHISPNVYTLRLMQVVGFVELGLDNFDAKPHTIPFPSYRAVIERNRELSADSAVL